MNANVYLAQHFARKSCGTLRILFCLGMARTFGHYEYSAYADGINYARYRWRGKTWIIPTTPVEEVS